MISCKLPDGAYVEFEMEDGSIRRIRKLKTLSVRVAQDLQSELKDSNIPQLLNRLAAMDGLEIDFENDVPWCVAEAIFAAVCEDVNLGE